MPTANAPACDHQDVEETDKCPRTCHTQTYCVWSEWQIDGVCSATCGKGVRTKKRHLVESPDQPQQATALYDGTLHTQADLQIVLISFIVGCLSTAALMSVSSRLFCRSRGRGYALLQQRNAVAATSEEGSWQEALPVSM